MRTRADLMDMVRIFPIGFICRLDKLTVYLRLLYGYLICVCYRGLVVCGHCVIMEKS